MREIIHNFERPRHIPKVQILDLGTDVVFTCTGKPNIRGTITRVFKPSFEVLNTYGWEVRYEIQDYYRKDTKYIIAHRNVRVNDYSLKFYNNDPSRPNFMDTRMIQLAKRGNLSKKELDGLKQYCKKNQKFTQANYSLLKKYLS